VISECSFGAETWLITQNLKPEKECVIGNFHLPPAEKMEAVISKDDSGKLSWDHKHVLVLDFLDHGDTVCCYCGILSLWRPLFAKCLSYFAKVLSFCMKMKMDSCLWL
jgi:hypothetical protein